MRLKKYSFLLVSMLALSSIFCSLFAPNEENEDFEPQHTQPAAPQDTKAPIQQETQPPVGREETNRRQQLAAVSHWFYNLGFEPDEEDLDTLINSTYDLVVIEPIATDKENRDYPIADLVDSLHNAPHPKLVIAYIDIGQAEDWRTYWEPDWGIGDPDWIVAEDPDGWEGNYPVAYWRDEWRHIWLDGQGYMQFLIDAGFDGIYMDWVEAYSDENVITAAEEDDVDPEEEIIRWVSDLADFGRSRMPDFLVIAQNAAELVEYDEYVTKIDALAQEQTWFDGSADNDPPGDCPLPRGEDDIESDEYIESLSPDCLRLFEEFPDSTLHVSSESYIYFLEMALDKSLVVFTIDYAIQPDNVAWIYQTARQLGFIPFVSERSLDIYLEPVP
ncbi:endo alpha-1,4 polygalactosaminidase [Chloroflexota bacterium]